MAYTEVTSQSWLSRLGGAFKGIVVGLVLFVAACVLLFWNEGRAVKRQKSLREGRAAVVSIAADRVDAGNQDKLVHVYATATTRETLADPVFPVSANALRLRRTVAMYQHEESCTETTRTKIGGGTETVTECTYDEKVWSDELIDSRGFRDPNAPQNPATMRFESWEATAKNVALGAFRLPGSLVERIEQWQPIDPPAAEAGSLPDGTRVEPGRYFLGADPARPRVGDLRVLFAKVPPSDVSILGRQVSDTFEPYRTSNGGILWELMPGKRSADGMFGDLVAANKTLLWILRVVGFLLMFIGLRMIMSPLAVAADVVPLFGRIVGAGTGIVAFLVAAIVSFLIVAVAWLVYRPLLGILFLAVAFGIAFLVIRRMRGASPAAAKAAE